MTSRPLLCLLLSAALAHAAPLSLKELEFLVRQRTPDSEIIQTASQRHLAMPIDAQAEKSLRAQGASDGLLAALVRPEMQLTPDETQSERRRRMLQEATSSQSAAEDAAFLVRRKQQEQQLATQTRRTGATRQMLDGKLVKLEGDQLKPFDVRQLQDVRVFAFYYSALWCGPCRQFSPKLVEAYKRLKAQYPTQFEVIFVSADRDEFNMREYMRTHHMDWPAVRFGAADDAIRHFGGESIPWLVAVSDTAQPLTRNGVDKKYIAPEEVLGGVEQLLAMLKK